MLLEPSFPGGAGGHQMTGGRGPSSTPHAPPPQTTPTTTGGLSWAPWRGESARLLIVVRHTLPSPSLSLPSAPPQVRRRQLLSVVRCCLSLGGVGEGKGEARACRKGTDLPQSFLCICKNDWGRRRVRGPARPGHRAVPVKLWGKPCSGGKRHQANLAYGRRRRRRPRPRPLVPVPPAEWATGPASHYRAP